MRSTNSGDQQNDAFCDLLNKFDAATDKEGWTALIEEATHRPVNFRQRQAIIERCENQILGIYGSTKRPEHYNHQKNTSNGK